MGSSIVLLQREQFELTIEIDRDVSVEMSTGFGPTDRTTAHINMPLSIDQLCQVIEEMKKVHNQLLRSWSCVKCHTLHPEEETTCPNCDF